MKQSQCLLTSCTTSPHYFYFWQVWRSYRQL